jgi:alkyl hydroperoxide reductase subunit F
MSNKYDCIIIGGGPAGMTAGIYMARKKLKTLILTKDIGGQAAWSSDVENYLGFTMIKGVDLVEKFEHHLEKYSDVLELQLENKGVSKVEKVHKYFRVFTGDNNKFEARSVIIAGGKVPRPLGVKGEKEYLNRGVTYCSWCDGPLFAGKDVAIIGGGNSALDAALNIYKTVKSIIIINITKELTGDEVMIDKVKSATNIRILNNTEVVKIIGEKFVTAVEIKEKGKTKKHNIDLEGVFIEVGSLPSTDYLKGVIKLNKFGEIIINSENMTSVEGLYAAGDITDIPEKQIVVAAGEGAKAAICASKYIDRFSN